MVWCIVSKHYNLTYFIRLFAIATFAGYKYVPFYRKPYKMFYIGFIMKTIKENISSKEFKKLMICTKIEKVKYLISL